VLLQDPDNLLFREPRSLHRPPLSGDGLYSFLQEVWGLRSTPAVPVIGVADCGRLRPRAAFALTYPAHRLDDTAHSNPEV
jgi:hypothetical protein